MKILLVTCGSRGDVQPVVALALGLASAGHEVRIAGPPEKAAWARGFGCRYVSLGRDVTAFVNRMDNAVRPGPALDFVRFVRQTVHDQFRELPGLVPGMDLTVGAGMCFALSSVAQANDVPYRYMAYTPQLLPSGSHPFPAVRTQTLPRAVNRLTWSMARLLEKGNLTLLVNRHRRTLGLPLLADAWDHILGDDPLVACDPGVLPVPKDVEKRWVQTGYLLLNLPRPMNPDLANFIRAGAPPIYVGFGSMPPKDQVRLQTMAVRAARRLGRRVILGGIEMPAGKPALGTDLFWLGPYPHLHLFPGMACVVHHGGAGTTAACLLSGTPQAIVPHILDQYYHGHCIYKYGLGPRPVWRSRLTEEKLAQSLENILDDPGIREKALTTARHMALRNGVSNAVAALVRPFG